MYICVSISATVPVARCGVLECLMLSSGIGVIVLLGPTHPPSRSHRLKIGLLIFRPGLLFSV